MLQQQQQQQQQQRQRQQQQQQPNDDADYAVGDLLLFLLTLVVHVLLFRIFIKIINWVNVESPF